MKNSLIDACVNQNRAVYLHYQITIKAGGNCIIRLNVMTIQEFSRNVNRELAKYDDVINTDQFGAYERFNELWNTIHTEIVNEFSLPPFHLWEDGFCKGDASDEEIENVASCINENYNENLEDESDLMYFLDQQFLLKIHSHAELLIQDYEREFKEEYKEARSNQ